MNENQRNLLVALYAALLGALCLPLPLETKRSLQGAASQLARDLGILS